MTSARTAGPATTPVSASMPDGRSTATVRAFLAFAASCGERRVRLAQPAPAADAEHPVDDEVRVPDRPAHLVPDVVPAVTGVLRHPGPARSSLVRRGRGAARPDDPAAGGDERPRAACRAAAARPGWRSPTPRGGPAARPRTARPRRCRRCPARIDHPRPVDRARAVTQQARADRGEPGRRPLHERAVGDERHQRGFRRPHLGNRVSIPHAASLPRAARPGSRTRERDAVRRDLQTQPSPAAPGCAFGDDHRAGDARVVAEREVPVRDAEPGGGRRDRAADLQVRPAARAGDDLGVGPEQAARRAERLRQGLLGREARRQGAQRAGRVRLQ